MIQGSHHIIELAKVAIVHYHNWEQNGLFLDTDRKNVIHDQV